MQNQEITTNYPRGIEEVAKKQPQQKEIADMQHSGYIIATGGRSDTV